MEEAKPVRAEVLPAAVNLPVGCFSSFRIAEADHS